MITADGCWADYRAVREVTRDRPCLFLDRDGVLIEDTGYPHVADEVVLIPEGLESAVAARRAGFAVGIISNQSGIGRGYFAWQAFAAVQAVIDAALAARGARLDFVLACPHHPDAALPALRGHHPWRKPAPGMLTAAAERLGLALDGSIMVGDRASDMRAAAASGVAHGLLLGDQEGTAPFGRRVTRAILGSALRALLPRPQDDR